VARALAPQAKPAVAGSDEMKEANCFDYASAKESRAETELPRDVFDLRGRVQP